MKTRHSILFVVLLLSSPLLVLAQVVDGTSNTIQIQEGRLPDLVPVDMTVDRDCRIVVLIRNNGPGIVPDAGYSLSPPGSSGVQMYSDAAPWGGIVLGGFDPSKLTQPVGGTASYTWFSSLPLAPGGHVVRVDVDNNNSIVENNEGNNSLTRKLACVRQLPDLQPIDVTLDSQCRVLVTLRNNGPSPVPDSEYANDAANAGVQLYKGGAGWGGVILGGADPTKATQPAGGTVVSTWWTAAANLTLPPGTHVMKVEVDNANHLAEANESNNTLTKTVTCGPDLQPVDITLDPQCRVLVTLRNNGPSPVPDSEYAIDAANAGVQLYKGAAGWGGVILGGADPGKATQPAGGTVVSTWWTGAANLTLTPGTHVMKVDVDNANHLVEVNESNNSLTKTVTCGPDLQPVDITLDPQCRILLTLRNNGPSAVPDSEYAHVAGNAVVQMYKGGAGWGGAILGGIDPGKGTQPAGGTVVSTWWTAASNLTLPFGTHVLKVDVDNNNHLAEANEGNNSLTKTLACQNAPPTSTKP